MRDLFAYLKRLRLAEADFAIFGSAPLLIRGIVDDANDLDVVCRGSAWRDVRKIGSLQFSDDYGVEIVTLFGGRVTFGNKWGIGDFNVDNLIDEAEFLDGLPFVKLKHVIEYK